MHFALARLMTCLPDRGDEFWRRSLAVQDWAELAKTAAEQGLASVLYHHLTQGAKEAPAPPRTQKDHRAALRHLRPYHLRQQALSVRLETTLADVLRTLHKHDVKSVVLKGPVLASRFYPHAGMRAASDLDLLVRTEDLSRATDALHTLDYAPLTGVDVDAYRRYHHHIPLGRKGFPPIDLHFRLQTNFGRGLAAEASFRRAIPHTWSSTLQETNILQPEDEFLYLAVHAAAHRFERWSWLYDLKLFLFKEGLSLSAKQILARAKDEGSLSALALTCLFLEDGLGASLPSSLRAIGANARMRLVQRWSQPGQWGWFRKRFPQVSNLAFALVLSDNAQDGIRCLKRRCLYHFFWEKRGRGSPGSAST